MSRILIYAIATLVLALAVAIGAALWFRASAASAGADAARAAASLGQAEAALRDERAARTAEQAKAKQLESIAAKFEQEKADAQATGDRVAADLRDGNLRLRRELGALYTAQLSGSAASAGQPDAGAERGAELAAAAVRVGAEYDARVRGLQAIIRTDRDGVTP